MVTKKRLVWLFSMSLTMLLLSACVRPFEESGQATPDTSDPNVGGGVGEPDVTPSTGESGDAGDGTTAETPYPIDTTAEATSIVETSVPEPEPTSETVEPTLEPSAEPTAEMTPTATAEAATPVPTPTVGATAIAPTPPTTQDGYIVHVVQPGENLFRIGLAYGYSWVVLAQVNGIPDPDRIVVGQQILIPAPGTDNPNPPNPAPSVEHVVRPGETLFSISLQYGVPWQSVAAANQISPPYVIYPPQVLIIPSG